MSRGRFGEVGSGCHFPGPDKDRDAGARPAMSDRGAPGRAPAARPTHSSYKVTDIVFPKTRTN